MTDVIRLEDEFYITAGPSLTGEGSRVLKQGETFCVFSRSGDINDDGCEDHGVYHEGTRHLSRLSLRLGGVELLLLSSTINEANTLFSIDLTNPDIRSPNGLHILQGSLHIRRSKFLWQGHCYERLRVRNFGSSVLSFPLCISFDADFIDIFEVRGFQRQKRGKQAAAVEGSSVVVLGYRGLDEVERRSHLVFDPTPEKCSKEEVRYELKLAPHEEWTMSVTLGCEVGGNRSEPSNYAEASEEFGRYVAAATAEDCKLETSNEQFNGWLNRSLSDLHMMITETRHGLYPYAGVPWFSTAFGRDGIITALETLWLDPKIARGVLRCLAALQATDVDEERDAEPGKILHETRLGELAALGEIPFERYYGSVDSTPLFVLLAGAYYERTGDKELLEEIWPSVKRAEEWIDRYGDLDGDGFIEYARHAERGLAHQGWKDSHDAVFHRDGSAAEGPIAMCEVQAYVYAAKCAIARLAEASGEESRAEKALRDAAALRERFDEAFWSDELSTYVMALDGRKNQCVVRSSNAGQCLFSGIAKKDRIRALAETLLAVDSFSGWGIRTIAGTEERYNPMSYHNGSVWPHDNALIASGLSLYGEKEAALKIFDGLFEASLYVDFHRLPELFCGFERRAGEGPTLYPAACSPQSWAAAAVFLLLQASLGLSVRGVDNEVRLTNPALPAWLEWVRIKNLSVGLGKSVDLTLIRHRKDVGINVTRKEGDVEVVVVK